MLFKAAERACPDRGLNAEQVRARQPRGRSRATRSAPLGKSNLSHGAARHAAAAGQLERPEASWLLDPWAAEGPSPSAGPLLGFRAEEAAPLQFAVRRTRTRLARWASFAPILVVADGSKAHEPVCDAALVLYPCKALTPQSPACALRRNLGLLQSMMHLVHGHQHPEQADSWLRRTDAEEFASLELPSLLGLANYLTSSSMTTPRSQHLWIS